MCVNHPPSRNVMSVVTDVSGMGIGGVLQVQRDRRWEVAAFFSRQTMGAEQWYSATELGAEQQYSATELEALAMVESIKHFGYYLYGESFTVFTDHKPLGQLLSSERLNGRLHRFAMKLQH